MFRYKILTLLILLMLLAVIPPMLQSISCSTTKEPSDRLQKLNAFYKLVRIPFPPDIKRVLDEPDRFTLFSIEGDGDIQPDVTEHSFYGFEILGKTEITDAQQRKALIQALDEGISEVMHGGAACFAPRHGISVVQDDTRFDLVICFECFNIVVLDGNGKHIFSTHTTADPAVLFNAALTSAHVPLATPPSH